MISISVSLQEECNPHHHEPVCDTRSEEFTNICILLSAGRHLDFRGHCPVSWPIFRLLILDGITVIIFNKIWTMWFYHRLMSQRCSGLVNSVDPSGGVWSVSTLFVQTWFSKNLGSMQLMGHSSCTKVYQNFENLVCDLPDWTLQVT